MYSQQRFLLGQKLEYNGRVVDSLSMGLHRRNQRQLQHCDAREEWGWVESHSGRWDNVFSTERCGTGEKRTISYQSSSLEDKKWLVVAKTDNSFFLIGRHIFKQYQLYSSTIFALESKAIDCQYRLRLCKPTVYPLLRRDHSLASGDQWLDWLLSLQSSVRSLLYPLDTA